MKKIHYQNVGFPRTGTTWLWENLTNHPEVFYGDSFIKKLKAKRIINEEKENAWQGLFPDELIRDHTQYTSLYADYDISLNFSPWGFKFSERLIKKVSEYTTHASFTLRNPYEVINSYHNMHHHAVQLPPLEVKLPNGSLHTPTYLEGRGFIIQALNFNQYKLTHPNANPNNTHDLIHFYIDDFNFYGSIINWKTVFPNSFEVFVYDDLKDQPSIYYSNVCKFLGLTPNDITESVINSTKTMSEKNNAKIFEGFSFEQDHKDRINKVIDQLSDFLGRDLSHWKR